MANKFLDSTGLGILWTRIKSFISDNYIDSTELVTAIDAIDEVKADKPKMSDGTEGTVEAYVAEYVANNASGGSGTLPSHLDIVCGDSTSNID